MGMIDKPIKCNESALARILPRLYKPAAPPPPGFALQERRAKGSAGARKAAEQAADAESLLVSLRGRMAALKEELRGMAVSPEDPAAAAAAKGEETNGEAQGGGETDHDDGGGANAGASLGGGGAGRMYSVAERAVRQEMREVRLWGEMGPRNDEVDQCLVA